MKITSEQIKTTAHNVGKSIYNGAKATGKFVLENSKNLKDNADEFIKSRPNLANAKDTVKNAVKNNKEAVLGGAVILGGAILAIKCIKGIIDKTKEVVTKHTYID